MIYDSFADQLKKTFADKDYVDAGLLRKADKEHGTHVTWSTTTPKANGTASVGSETKVARGDHIHPLQTTVSGNAGTATKLQTARNINGTSFDGTKDITTANWGTSRTLTIGNKGQSVNGSQNITWTLSDIGAVAKTGDTMSGSLKINGAASNYPLRTRSVVGNTADGSAIDDLYLQYGANKKVLLGNSGAYSISEDGSKYSGTAAKATVLENSRNITIGNKTNAFNGSGNISFTLSDIGAAASGHTHDGYASSNHGTHLTLGTTSSTAYRGDYGNTAYKHSQAAHAPSNAQKNSDITKAEIEAKLTGTISSHTHSMSSHTHTAVNGITLQKVSMSTYNSMTKDANTLYIIAN